MSGTNFTMSHTTNASTIVSAIFKAREAKTKAGGIFTVKQAEAIVAEQLAILYPAKTKRTGPKMVGEASDEEFLVWLEGNPAYAGIDVRRELGKAQAWAGVKGKSVSRSRFVNWLNKAERTVGYDGRMASSMARKTEASGEPPRWRERLAEAGCGHLMQDDNRKWSDLSAHTHALILTAIK